MKNKKTIGAILIALFIVLGGVLRPGFAQDQPSPLASPGIPAGPRPTATVTPLQTTPVPTATVTPLPSASPSGTQPQTTNTVAPSPAISPTGTPPQTSNTVTPTPAR